MLRRLALTYRPCGAGRILSGVPRPRSLSSGHCALARALLAALRHAGCQATYDSVMGLTGMAFMLPFRAGLHCAAGDADRCAGLSQALRTMGLHASHKMCAPGEDLIQAVRASIDEGFAVPVLGWPHGGDDWGILTGYDQDRQVVCGWPAASCGEQYEGGPPRAEALVVITGRGPSAAQTTAFAEVVQRAAAGDADLSDAYRHWQELLAAQWGDDPEDPEFNSRFLRHETATEALADARTAAASFLRTGSQFFDSVPAAWLLHAAEHYEALVEQIEARDPQPFEIGAAQALASPEWRAEWQQALRQIAELDLRALHALRQAFTTDHDPYEPIPYDVP